MPDEIRRMPPGPNDRVSIDYGGFDTSGPLALSNLEQSGGGTNSLLRLGMGVVPRFALSQLEKAKASGFVPYEERVAKYEKKHGDLPPNPFATGLQAGFLGGFSGDVGFAETLSDIIPGDPGKESLKSAGDFLEKEAYKYPMRTLRDIHDAGDFGGFVAQSIGQTFGYIGSMIPTTIATGGVGAVSRIVGREALKGLTKKEIAKQGGKALGRAVTAPSIVKNIGHTYRGVREETGVESPGIAIPVGIASGMLERFGLGKSFESFFDALPPGAKKELWKKMVASGLKAAGKSSLIEGGTEAGQETLQLLANRLADSTYDIVNGENAWRVLDATAMGAFGAAPIGAVGGAGNYYTAVGEAQDRKLVEDVLKKVEAERRVHEKGSPILFAVGQREIQKHADLLDDNELIPTEEQVGALERFSERIQSQASLSPEQKQALQSNSNSVLARFKERVGTAHADKKADEAQGKSDLETAARESRESAEAAVAPEQQVMPETAILSEERAPYNYPESAYQVGQEYKHRLHSAVDGETIQVDGVVTKVGSDGRVLESVVASTVNDTTPTPLIVTRRKKTRSLHTQNEVEAEMDIAARVPSDPKVAKSAEERSAEVQSITDRLKRDRGQADLKVKMAAEAGATIPVPKRRTAEQNIQKQKDVAAKSRTPLKEAKSGRFRKVYTAPEPAVSKSQSEAARLNRAKKVIENSSVVEVSKPGEKRSVGAVVSSTLAPFAGETHGMRVFVAEVLFEDSETDSVTIKEDLSITQPMNGGVVVLAKNGKLTEEQEVVVSAAENVTEEQETERVAAVRATHSQVFGKKQPRATAEASPHQEKPSKDVSLTKDAAQKSTKSEVKKTKGISGIELTDPALIDKSNKIKKEQDDDAGMVFDITGAVPYAFKRLSQIIRLIIIDIKQAIINKKIKRGFNKKARRSKKQGFMSYKDLRQAIIEKHSEAIKGIEIDNVNPHLPAYSDDPERFLGGIFDAVVDLGGEAFEGDLDQGAEVEVLSRIEEVLRKYIDFPIADKADTERSIVAANSNTYKNTDTGWTINGLDLYSDNMSESFTAVLDFSTQHGNVISIKAMGKGMDALSYRLKAGALEKVRFQESEVEGREGIVTFAHIPESLLLDEDGNVQYDNWEYDSSKGGGRFLKDISWVGVSRDEFIGLIKERTKSKQLKELLNSEAGEAIFSSKDQIAGIIANAISLAKDPRYSKLKGSKTAAFKAISKISKGKVANLKIDQLPKLFEHAVNLHLDHFVTITENQLAGVDPTINELNRLTVYYNKLKAAIEGNVPKLMDLPKIGTIVDTGEFTREGKKKGKLRYRIENVPNDPNNLTPIRPTDTRILTRDKHFSFAEKREAVDERQALPLIPKGWVRKSLRQEDLKFANEMLSELKYRIDQLKNAVEVSVGAGPHQLIKLQAPILPAIARKIAYEAKEDKFGDVDLLLEPEEGVDPSSFEADDFDDQATDKGYTSRVDDAINVVQTIKNYTESGENLSEVINNVFFYADGIEAEQQKFGAEYRTTLLVDEAKEVNLAAEAGDKVNKMGVAVGGETAATGEVSPSEVVEKKEREVERGKFEEGGFEENTELGRASKLFRGARKKLVELVQKGSAEDEEYATKLMGYQVQMLDAWNEFLEKRGTDFLLFDGVTLEGRSQRDYDLYNALREENVSRLNASSIYESREDKIKRHLKKFEEADKRETELFDSFISADKAAQVILTSIKKDTQSFLDDAKSTEDGMQVLMDLGWAGPRGGVKKLTASDVMLEAVLLKPERFAEPGSGLDYVNFSGLSAATTSKLSDLRPSIDEYKKAKAERDALASALTMFDQELGYIYGLGNSIYASDVIRPSEDEFSLIKKGKGVFGKGEYRLNAKDFERLRKREAVLAEDIAEFEEAGLKVDAKRARRERKQVKKLLTYFRDIAVTKEARKQFKLTARKVKKRGAYFKIIFDSFYRGGASSMDPGSMFGTLVSLSNKFNEDQYRSVGKFVQVGIKGTDRVETPTTLYYKLYKILEIRDPYKILEHPLFSNSGLYLGPIIPEGNTKEGFLDRKEKIRSKIDGMLRSYAGDYNLDENQARRMFLRNDMLGAVFNEFIQLFTHEAGMIDKESIVKKVTDLGAKKEIVLDHLAQGLDVPFKPRIVDEDDIEPEEVQKELSKLGAELGAAKLSLQQAKEQYAANKDLLDRSKRGALGVAKKRGAKSFKGVLDEANKLKEKADKLRDDLQFAETEVTKAARAIEAIEGDPKTLTGDQTKTLESSKLTHKKNQKDLAEARKRADLPLDQKQKLVAALTEKVAESKEVLRLSVEGMRMSGNSLDIIPSKYLSTTIQQTMPFGYTAVRSDRPSPDLPIQDGRPWDAMLSSGGAVTSEESKELGSSVGGDGVAQLLEDNRARLGDAFVDKAVAFLGNIPDKYLNELTLSIRTSLRSDKGLELGGSFMEAIKTVFIPAEGNTPDSFIHEFSHYLHAFLPKDMQSKVADMRRDALMGVMSGTKDGDLRYRLEIVEDLLSNIDSKVQFDADHFQNYLDKYGDRAKDMYHLINDNEFFAYLMTNEGQSDMTKLTPQNNPVGFISRAKQFLSDLVDWILKKARFVSAEKQFVDDVLAKFKYGDFTIERRKFTAGPALDASILTAKDLNRAIEFNVRTSLLGEEGNVEAGKKLSLEASSFHNMVYELSQKILKEMGEAEEFRNLLGKTKFKEGEFVTEPDDEITISRRAAALAGIKESEAIRKILEDNEVSTGGVVYSAEGYLELLEIRKTNPEAIPDSMWDQVSREFFKNTEEFLESYKFIRAQAEKVKSEKEVEKLMSLMSEVKEKFGTKDVARKSAASFKSMYKSMLEKVKDRSAENEAIKRLTQYGFDLNQLTSQLDDKLVGPQIFRVVENFYNTIWFNEDAQIILHKGVNRDGEKATWKDLVWTYIVEKGIHEKYLHKKDVRPYRTRGKGIIKTTQPDWDKDMEAMFAEVEPIMKFAADHILKKHQNDLLLNEVSEKQLQDSFEAYTDYEKEISDLINTDRKLTRTKGGVTREVATDGLKLAVEKLMKDYTSATGDLAVANRLFLSIRRSVLAKIKKRNDILVGAELASRIVESKEFSDARKEAAYEIQAKPEEEIRFDQERAHFPHPNPEKSFTLTYDLSDIKGRERQLEGLSLYIQDINDWLTDNPEDPFVPAWKEIRDNASATMLSPTMRNGQSMKAIVNMSYVRPLQNLLANIGTYTSRLAMQHLDNWSLTIERSANWRDLHQNKMAKALMDAAVSHGFGKGPIGVADWVSVIGRRYFGSANQVGRKLSIGDVVTRSDLTDVKTITKEDKAALDLQVEAFGELFDMDVKAGRGDVIASRKIKEPLRKRGRAGKERVLGRKALKVTPWTLPKTFNTLAKRFAQIVSSLIDDSNKEAQDIDAMEGINESDKRELKLKLFTRENRKGDSIMRLVSESFDRVVLPFLDNREGNITRGTNPFFTEGVYDEARDALLAGEINDMADLAAFFSERSVDITKLGEEDAPMQLNNKEALYELLREISLQAKGFNDFLSPPVDSERQDYKYQKLQHDSPFTTARQEAVANYFYYDYGSFQTVGVATMAIEAGTQYLDMYMSAMEAVAGELQAAVTDRKRAAEAGFLEDFLEQKKQGAANKEVFLDYERAEAHLANVQHEIRQLREFQDRDIKFELATNKTFRRVFGDVIGAATQILTVGIANIVGTPVRGAMRMQSMFGAAPRLNADFAWVALKEMAKGAASFGVGFTKGAFYGLGYLGSFKPRKALIKFVDEFVNQPFAKDISIGQYKINSTMRRLHDAGYAMKIDVQGKIDAYLDSVETRGRVEREDDLRTRSDTRSALSKLYNGAALFLVEIPGMTTPRLFDAIGNNVSFAWANSAVSNLEIRLKDLHRKYGASLWDRYNDPDALVKDPNKANTLSPVDAYGEQFIFKGDESKLGQLENIFTHGALDYHAEALRFYKLLDSDKEATFLSPDQRAQIGIGIVTSENLATVANRPLAMRNDPNLGYAFALAGWSISAAHNSVEFLSKARGGKQGWAMDSLNVQVALVALGMMTVAGIGWATQEQILRMIYKHLFGEIKTGKHPWEADSVGEGGRRALLYALSGFPILNSLPNQVLNDQRNMASMGPDLFIQNKLRDTLNVIGQIGTTRNLEGIERALLVYIKQTYPNSRYLVNRFPSISGTVDLRNNSRLIRRYAPRDMIKVSSYTGGGLTATPLTPMVALMANYATLGEWDLFQEYYRKAINEARRLGRPNPETYVRSLYFGKDPYRAALKGRPTQAVRRRVINSMNDADKEEYLRTENNFYNGLTRIGGNRPSFGGGVPFTLSKPKTSRSSGTEWRPTIPLPDMASPSPLRRAY